MRAKKAGPLTAARADVAEICRALGFLLVEPGAVVELRVPNTRKGTVSGYFTDYAKLAAEAAAWSGQAPGVAITVNPVAPEAEPGTAEEREAKATTAAGVAEAEDMIRQLLEGGTEDAEAIQSELKRARIPERDWRKAKSRL